MIAASVTSSPVAKGISPSRTPFVTSPGRTGVAPRPLSVTILPRITEVCTWYL